MNKIAKGAIATGVGVILLAGGGGTLATWEHWLPGTSRRTLHSARLLPVT